MIINEVVGRDGVEFRESVDLEAGTASVSVGGSGSRPITFAERRSFTEAPPAVQYVSVSGDNSLSGHSWASPKADLNAAIDALPPGGGVVHLGAGVWNGRWRIDKPNVHVIGMGRGPSGSVLRLPDRLDIPAATMTITGDGSSIRGVRIDGNRDNNIGFSDGQSDGIGVFASNTVVENCWITGARSHAYIVWGNAAELAHGQNAERGIGPRRFNRFVGNVVEKNGCAQDRRAAVDWAYLGGDTSMVPTDWEATGNTIIGSDEGNTCFTSHSGRRGIIANNVIHVKTMGVEIHTGSLDVIVANNMFVATNAVSRCVYIRTNTKRVNVVGNTFTSDGVGNNRIQAMVHMTSDCDLVRVADNIHYDTGSFPDACILRYDGGGMVDLIGNTLASKANSGAYLVRGSLGTADPSLVKARFNRCVNVAGAYAGVGSIDAKDNWGIADT
jgi:hypothetical protein